MEGAGPASAARWARPAVALCLLVSLPFIWRPLTSELSLVGKTLTSPAAAAQASAAAPPPAPLLAAPMAAPAAPRPPSPVPPPAVPSAVPPPPPPSPAPAPPQPPLSPPAPPVLPAATTPDTTALWPATPPEPPAWTPCYCLGEVSPVTVAATAALTRPQTFDDAYLRPLCPPARRPPSPHYL